MLKPPTMPRADARDIPLRRVQVFFRSLHPSTPRHSPTNCPVQFLPLQPSHRTFNAYLSRVYRLLSNMSAPDDIPTLTEDGGFVVSMPFTPLNDLPASSNDHFVTQRPATLDERARWSTSLEMSYDRGRDTRRPTSSRLRFPSVDSEVSEHPSHLPNRRRRRPSTSDTLIQGTRNAPQTPSRRAGWDYFEGVDLTGEDPQDIENDPVITPAYRNPPDYNSLSRPRETSIAAPNPSITYSRSAANPSTIQDGKTSNIRDRAMRPPPVVQQPVHQAKIRTPTVNCSYQEKSFR